MSRKSSAFTLLIAALIVWAIVTYALRVSPPSELQVYRAVLVEIEARNFDAVVMSRATQCGGGFDSAERLGENFGDSQTFSVSLYQSFVKANGEKAVPIQIGSLSDLTAVIDYDAAKSYQRAPGLLKPLGRDIVTLSRVGFNVSQTEALLCIEGVGGSLFHLRHGQYGWELVSDYSVWIS